MYKLIKYSYLFFLLSLVGCNTTGQKNNEDEKSGETSTIIGVVTYRERIALPENAKLTVKLQDTAKQDVAAVVISEKTVDLSMSPPWQFTLHYDVNKITPIGQYSLQASVEVDGKLRFINTHRVEAFNSKEPINIVVSAVSKQASYHQEMVEVHSWLLTKINGKPFNTSVTNNAGQAAKNIGIQFTEKGAIGFAGCNHFNGRYDITETTLTFPPMMMTMMTCPDSGLESDYLKALSMVQAYKLDGASLMMLNQQGDELLQFKITSSK